MKKTDIWLKQPPFYTDLLILPFEVRHSLLAPKVLVGVGYSIFLLYILLALRLVRRLVRRPVRNLVRRSLSEDGSFSEDGRLSEDGKIQHKASNFLT